MVDGYWIGVLAEGTAPVEGFPEEVDDVFLVGVVGDVVDFDVEATWIVLAFPLSGVRPLPPLHYKCNIPQFRIE